MIFPRFKPALLFACLITLLFSCKPDHADLLLINGVVHTENSKGEIRQAIAIRDGKIIEVGTTDDIVFRYRCNSIIDLEGRAVFPGFFDAHCHFIGYAKLLNEVDLTGTSSFEEVLARVDSFATTLAPGEWLIGRGWDQNDWKSKNFPDNLALNEKFPDRPVILHRVDGHAALCNQKALDLAGIDLNSKKSGGVIEKKGITLTGILIDNAMDLVTGLIPEPNDSILQKLLIRAENNCFAAGLTTLDDAGLSLHQILFIDSLQKKGILKIRIYAMADPSDENLEYFISKGPLKTDRLHVCSFKLYADGALGSRGACLLAPYKDEPETYGLILHETEYYENLAEKLYAAKFQVNTHCIGDSAVRMITRIYSEYLKPDDDRRWRIEHAQVVSPEDFSRFKEYKIWPSVQPTHAMSDQPWAEDRIGKERLAGAYAYETLLEQNGKIAFGTDFPVEGINPIMTFHAAIARIRPDGNPYGGFMPEQAVGRDTAIRAMTIWAAESNFEEKEKGSIEVGKLADFVVLNRDIMFAKMDSIPTTKVLYTIVNGKVVYKRKP